MAVLLAVTLLPVSLDIQHALVDKTWHFLAFGALGFLGFAVWEPNRWPLVGLICIGLGASIEILQATPWIGRDADLRDWLADVAGVGFAAMVWTWIRARRA